MTVKSKEQVCLRYPVAELPRRTELCMIEDDTFLPRDPTMFSPVTAQVAAALSMSAEDEALLTQNLRNLGYTDILSLRASGGDKIGMTVASRLQNEELQIAVILQGTSGDEWYSNFDIGYTAEHSGFAKAADYAELKLGDYVFTHAIGREPRFFLTGYSRGGAVANILSKRLCDRYGLEQVCAYTFASPATTISRRTNRYNTIFNLVRAEDFFTRVPLRNWGYTRYGKTVSLSGHGDMTARYRAITGDDYIGFTRQTAVENFLLTLQRLSPNVHAYYERRRTVGESKLSLYEFMRAVADMLSQNMDEQSADVFVTAITSDYADMISFLSSGADLADILSSTLAVPKCSVADSHCPAAYMAALDVFLEEQGAELAHPRYGGTAEMI